MFTEPSGKRGTFGVVNFGHCAISGGDIATAAANSSDANTLTPASRTPSSPRGSR